MTKVIDAEGASTTTMYDRASRVTQVINARGKSSFTDYFKVDRVKNSVDALTHRTTYQYDLAG